MSLVVAPSASFVPAGVFALPWQVESSAWVLLHQEKARIWISVPGQTRTLQFQLDQAGRFRELAPLPLAASGVAHCGRDFIVTGVDSAGLALAISTDGSGEIRWKTAIPSLNPDRWPVPGCAGEPLAVWQAASGDLEVADIGPAGARLRGSYPVGGPPLSIAFAGDAIWTAWSDESGVWAFALGAPKIQVDTSFAPAVAVGGSATQVWIAWARDGSTWLASLRNTRGDIAELDLATATGGSFAVLPCEPPLIWARKTDSVEAEPLHAISVLTGPDCIPLEIKGLVHDVSCNRTRVAVLGASEVRFFERQVA